MKRVFAALAVVGALASPAAAEDVTIETALGPVSIAQTPQSTAVFDIASLDILDALGVTGLTSIDHPRVSQLEKYQGEIGTIFEPDFEALNALNPDLVIAGGRSSTQVEALSRMLPTIDMTIWGDDLLDLTRARIEAYGKLYDLKDRSAEMVETLDQKIESTKAAVKDKGNALILLTNGNKISVYGAGGRFGWLHHELGLPEVIEGLEDTEHGESVSFEFIRETDPDWILVLDRVAAIGAEGQSAQATLDNAIMSQTKAAQNGHIVYLNAADIYLAGGGYQSTLNTLDILEQAFGSAGS